MRPGATSMSPRLDCPLARPTPWTYTTTRTTGRRVGGVNASGRRCGRAVVRSVPCAAEPRARARLPCGRCRGSRRFPGFTRAADQRARRAVITALSRRTASCQSRHASSRFAVPELEHAQFGTLMASPPIERDRCGRAHERGGRQPPVNVDPQAVHRCGELGIPRAGRLGADAGLHRHVVPDGVVRGEGERLVDILCWQAETRSSSRRMTFVGSVSSPVVSTSAFRRIGASRWPRNLLPEPKSPTHRTRPRGHWRAARIRLHASSGAGSVPSYSDADGEGWRGRRGAPTR